MASVCPSTFVVQFMGSLMTILTAFQHIALSEPYWRRRINVVNYWFNRLHKLSTIVGFPIRRLHTPTSCGDALTECGRDWGFVVFGRAIGGRAMAGAEGVLAERASQHRL